MYKRSSSTLGYPLKFKDQRNGSFLKFPYQYAYHNHLQEHPYSPGITSTASPTYHELKSGFDMKYTFTPVQSYGEYAPNHNQVRILKWQVNTCSFITFETCLVVRLYIRYIYLAMNCVHE